MKARLFLLLLIMQTTALLYSTSWIDESRDCIINRQYETLFHLITDQYEKNPSADLLLMKTDAALQYYSKTMSFQMFSFKNLAPGESLLDSRLEEGSFSSFFFDLPAELKTGMTRWPHRGDLDYKLTQVLEEGSLLFGKEWAWYTEKDKKENLLFSAWNKNFRSTELIRELAEIVTDGGDWHTGSELYRLLLDEEETRKNRYRYTICLVKSGQYSNAEKALQPLLASAANDEEKLPLYRLSAYIAESMENWEKAHNQYKKIDEILPGDADNYGNIIRTSLSGGNRKQAYRESDQFLAFDPSSPGRMQMLMELYAVSDQERYLEDLWPHLISVYKNSPPARGNILFHKAVFLLKNQKNREALICLDEAEKIFLSEGKEINQEAIEEIRRLKMEESGR